MQLLDTKISYYIKWTVHYVSCQLDTVIELNHNVFIKQSNKIKCYILYYCQVKCILFQSLKIYYNILDFVRSEECIDLQKYVFI